ncbi:polysaccharide biosynthesis protein [Lacisediminimonas profundi]|uniref:polysaccharide biosynthesis protein n=1 Tax=Lacisediminimonas profundi TaxID=2603856 RepID=UPI00124AF2EC|nr:nucleoside-diphosphate sugar epimerase/dehydratase [Lacisediminimonas profundi]
MSLQRVAVPVLALPRLAKRLLVLIVDASLCALTVWLAFYLRLGEWTSMRGDGMQALLASIGIALPIFIVSGLYRAIFRYSGWPALLAVTKAILVYGLAYATIFTAIGMHGVPRTIGLIQPILLLLAVGASRALATFWLGGMYRSHLQRARLPKVLIYGAGSAGRELATAMVNSHEMQAIGFLDDDIRLQGNVLNGLPIYSPDDVAALVESLGVSHVLLAIPSATRKRRNEILNGMLDAKVSVRTLPTLIDLAQGRVSTTDVHELEIEDLLGRDPVTPNHILLGKNVRGKVVLITGAGGSIGSELCRQIVMQVPHTLLLVEQSEFALYEMHQELLAKLVLEGLSGVKLVPLLASVQDEERMREVMLTWRPHTVYHAAAYKHVPLVEHNPAEGIKNNVFGTYTTAKAAIDAGASDFVLISTDKAVRPTNIMGASKRLAEMVLQALSAEVDEGKSGKRGTQLSMVRFGNVLGSSGSVVPKFRQQIKDGGPITLTHPDITRYFMTIPEAAQLVIQAGAMAKGGDVFVLDMGEPVRIVDLARRMAELSGLTIQDECNPDGDIAINITGLRPGEKLYEELLIGDNPQATSHPRIMRARESFLPLRELEEKLQALRMALEINDVGVMRQLLAQLVSGYSPSGDIVDWVHLENGNEGDGFGEAAGRRLPASPR